MSTINLISSQDITLPPVLYKYRDWDNDFHKRLLTEGEIFISSPALLNDPFDCNIPVSYEQLANDERLAQIYFQELVNDQFPFLDEKEKKKEIQKLINDGRFRDQEWVVSKEKEHFKSLCEFIGIVSFSDIKNNILMWSHYSNSHKGFCVGINSRMFSFGKNRKWGGGNINYVDEYPIILPTEDYSIQINKQLFTKHKTWSYENEYRLFRPKASNTVEKISEDDISEIILGYAISSKNEKEILDIVANKYPNTPIFKMQPIRNQFELKPERIK